MLKYLNNDGIRIKFVKVKGHNGDTFNELADEEAVKQSKKAKEIVNESDKNA